MGRIYEDGFNSGLFYEDVFSAPRQSSIALDNPGSEIDTRELGILADLDELAREGAIHYIKCRTRLTKEMEVFARSRK